MPLPLVAKIEVHSTTGDALPPSACLEGYRAPESHVENVPAACGCLRHTREPQMAQDIHVFTTELRHYCHANLLLLPILGFSCDELCNISTICYPTVQLPFDGPP